MSDGHITTTGVGYANIDAPDDTPNVSANTDDGWHNSDATVTPSASDADSGVQRIEYLVDDTGTRVVAENNGFVAPAACNDGAHAHQYCALAAAGNYSDVRTRTVMIDITAPTPNRCTCLLC